MQLVYEVMNAKNVEVDDFLERVAPQLTERRMLCCRKDHLNYPDVKLLQILIKQSCKMDGGSRVRCLPQPWRPREIPPRSASPVLRPMSGRLAISNPASKPWRRRWQRFNSGRQNDVGTGHQWRWYKRRQRSATCSRDPRWH